MTSSHHDVSPGGVPPRPAAGPSAVAAAGDRLIGALRTRTPCAPVRDLIGPADVAAGYAVQQHLNAARTAAGARVVGRKIGATSAAVQDQLGVDQPDFGVLFDDMAQPDGGDLPSDRLLQPRVEAEVAFVLSEDLADGSLGRARVRDAVAYAVAALEIVDSRIRDWDISFADTVADNASSGLYVLGSRQRRLLDVDPAEVEMSLSIDGEEVATGTGAACLGDPLEAVAWLAHQARTFGEPLRAGQLVLSGALGPMRPLTPGSVVTAEISGLGAVSTSLPTSGTPYPTQEDHS